MWLGGRWVVGRVGSGGHVVPTWIRPMPTSPRPPPHAHRPTPTTPRPQPQARHPMPATPRPPPHAHHPTPINPRLPPHATPINLIHPLHPLTIPCSLGVFPFYRVVRGATEPRSLLANAGQVSRFAAPLAYNYLHVIRMHEYIGEGGRARASVGVGGWE